MNILKFTSKHFLKLCLAFWVLGLAQGAMVAVRERNLNNFSWKLTQYFVNYFDFGFVKRGLLGTLLHPVFTSIGTNRILAVSTVLLFDFSIVFGGLVLIDTLCDRMSGEDGNLGDVIRFLIVFSPLGVMQLSYDAGRFDHVNIILVLLSLVLVLRGFDLVAGILLGIGVLVHEAVFVFGLPVLLAICIATHRDDRLAGTLTALLKLAVIPSACALAVAVLGNSNVDFASVLPAGFDGGQEVWHRGLFELPTTLGPVQYAIVAFYAVTPFLFLRHFYRSNDLPLDIVFFAPLCAFALFAFGVDYARWCHLILLSILVVVVFHAMLGKSDLKKSPMLLNALFFLYALPLGPIGTDIVLPYLETASRRVLGV